MWFTLTLTLFLATPNPKGAPPADTDPFARLPSAAAVTFTDYLETRKKLGQTLEVLETLVEKDTTRAVLLERTGCLRGWIVLSSSAAKSKSEAPGFEATELFERNCKQPGPLMHFARLQDALRRRDATAAAPYLGTNLHFPLATEGAGRPTRKTLTGELVASALKGAQKDPKARPPLPLCDLTRETASCSARASAEAWTCECVSPGRRVTYELRRLEPTLGADSPIQVVSVKERTNR